MTALPDTRYRDDMRWAALLITYAFIERFVAEHSHRPTIFEIARARGLSYEVARGQVELMQYRGWIYRDVLERGIELKGVS